MANPVLHIKDAYYFEIPKFLTSKVSELDQVPAWLTKAHPEAGVEEFAHELHGKILIPQPFGEPGALYPVMPPPGSISPTVR